MTTEREKAINEWLDTHCRRCMGQKIMSLLHGCHYPNHTGQKVRDKDEKL